MSARACPALPSAEGFVCHSRRTTTSTNGCGPKPPLESCRLADRWPRGCRPEVKHHITSASGP
eukprot:12245909-Alexandrium_andersonii.AAC.1